MITSIDHLLEEIGEDADLLTKSDAWLEEEHRYHAGQVAKNIEELQAINLAIKIKKLLQDKNLVPLQMLKRDDNGQISDILVEILKLPEAIRVLEVRHDYIDELNAAGHLLLWQNDGYDIPTSMDIAQRSEQF